MDRLEFALPSYRPDTANYRPVFTASQLDGVKKQFGFEGVEVYDADELTEGRMKGAFGHVVMFPIVIESASWTVKTGTNSFETKTTDEIIIAIAMLDPSRTKNMEMTDVEGRDGSVKEYGSHGDYLFSIKGLLIGKDGKFPEEEMKSLALLENAPVSVPVACDFLMWLGVTEMVIRRVGWIPMEGVENAQAFEMDCVSDTEVLLKLKSEL
jgi:hypothetical protein